MPNDMVTAGNRAPQVEFPSSVLPVLWLCTTVFPWFTPSLMDCYVWSQVIAFGGAYRFTVFVHISDKKNSCNSKVVFKHFHRDSNIIWKHTKTGWWFQPLWKILVIWDHYSQSMGNKKYHQSESHSKSENHRLFSRGYLVDHQVVMVEVKLWVAKLQLNMRPKITLDLLDSWLLFASTSKSVINAVESLKTTNLTRQQ